MPEPRSLVCAERFNSCCPDSLDGRPARLVSGDARAVFCFFLCVMFAIDSVAGRHETKIDGCLKPERVEEGGGTSACVRVLFRPGEGADGTGAKVEKKSATEADTAANGNKYK
eukprot:2862044-Amphidinium_carterae.2